MELEDKSQVINQQVNTKVQEIMRKKELTWPPLQLDKLNFNRIKIMFRQEKLM